MVVKEGLYDAKYSIRHLMGSGPPLGQNLAPAAICSAVYFVCAGDSAARSQQAAEGPSVASWALHTLLCCQCRECDSAKSVLT